MSIMNGLVCERYDFDVVKIPVEPAASITLGIAVPSLENCAPAARHFIEFATKELGQL
jgi:ABC-type molybdate transport system substrate-binding protein